MATFSLLGYKVPREEHAPTGGRGLWHSQKSSHCEATTNQSAGPSCHCTCVLRTQCRSVGQGNMGMSKKCVPSIISLQEMGALCYISRKFNLLKYAYLPPPPAFVSSYFSTRYSISCLATTNDGFAYDFTGLGCCFITVF